VRAWVFGDDLNTDVIAPGRYMKASIDEMAKHCLEAVNPGFTKTVMPGDILVAGRNLGAGSSREQAPAALKHLGVAALVAESFAGLFYRNSLNLGLAAVVCADAKRVRDGDDVQLDFDRGVLVNRTTSETLSFEPIPPHLLEMVRDGGLLPHLEKRLKCRTTS
jgi:3-isopropylmalate/(R)-2-methylmalate dehydratase small subunit